VREILLTIESAGWPEEGILRARLTQILDSVFACLGFVKAQAELSVLFTDDVQMCLINAQWRGIDRPTNVLSFPAFALKKGEVPQSLLGDIVFAFETIEREATQQQKPFFDHLTHLMVHGILHLLGFDHQQEAEAEQMEALEREILSLYAIPDPYQEQ